MTANNVEMKVTGYVNKEVDGRKQKAATVKFYMPEREDEKASDGTSLALSHKFAKVNTKISVANLSFDQLTAKIALLERDGGHKPSIKSLTEAHHNIASDLGSVAVQTKIMQLKTNGPDPKEDPDGKLWKNSMNLLQKTFEHVMGKETKPAREMRADAPSPPGLRAGK